MTNEMAKISNEGILALPKSILDRLKLDENSGLAIYLENNQIVLKKISINPVDIFDERPSYR